MLLLYVGQAFAQPSADLEGPLKARQGQLIILTVKEQAASKVAWDVKPDVRVPLDIDPEAVAESIRTLKAANFEVPELTSSEVLWAVSQDGRSLYLASYPGSVQVAVGVLVGEDIAVKNHTVVISGAGPAPEPDDPDPPPPDPDPPLTGLALEAKEQALAIDRRAGEAVQLSSAFRGVARRAEAETWTADKLWGGELRAAVASVIATTEQRSRWQPFSTWMNEAFPAAIRGDMPEVTRRLGSLADGLEQAEGK